MFTVPLIRCNSGADGIVRMGEDISHKVAGDTRSFVFMAMALPRNIKRGFFMADKRLYEDMMRRALRLARRGQGRTSPNPMVGAVVFKGDKIIATGYHKRAGLPHAEAEALRQAGDEARGAELAVTLEPCCHQGRTPPCTEAIIKAGIKKVIYAIKDPFQRVCGRGARRLEGAGIKTISGILADEAERLNEVYLHYIHTGRPFAILKSAQTLDGRVATRTGDSQWISCPEALDLSHRLRAICDAVAVGAGTVRADNPSLTVRRVKGDNPLRIILTTSRDLSDKIKLFRENKDHNTIVATSRDVIRSRAYPGVINWPVKKRGKMLDLRDFLDQSGKRGVTSIMFEGGGSIATALWKMGLVDKFYLVIAPLIIGQGIDSIGDLGITKVARGIEFERWHYKKIGTDVLFVGYPKG